MPEEDSLIVERQKLAGAIMLGKTNVPEFAAGAQTFNPIFGATANPYHHGMTCGGSSGGSAVALACRMAPLADGSDMGGSLRIPASFCNVVGLRPSPGLVPIHPQDDGWQTLAVEGPMARSVADLALLLSVIAGPDNRSPLTGDVSLDIDALSAGPDVHGLRIGWSTDLGGLAMEPSARGIIDSHVTTFETLGCIVTDEPPPLEDAEEIFHALRALQFELSYGEYLDNHRDQLKDSIIWNIEQGRALSGPDVARVYRLRTRLWIRMLEYFERHDYLVTTTVQTPPFDINTEWPKVIDGHKMHSYIDWMRSCCWISATGLPAISVPAGFAGDGLPVGLQIVGPPRSEPGLLGVAAAFEHATGFAKTVP